MLYIISCEFNNNDKEKFTKLSDEIESIGPSSYVFNQSWFLKSSLAASDIYDQLIKYISENDKIFIGQINDQNTDCWMPSVVTDWLYGE